ncbi:insulin-like growth factor-binding protein 7 [Hyalella azteca]|uniref:Insulin-like growth factor-binding protein 7 n=1 Tax=Hyalella azteca TaxID=294128 RepID=A0A8B7N3N4_HYAAZ|nr:insulin-like growth factor-binding protein 7 [Hyalella azteca]
MNRLSVYFPLGIILLATIWSAEGFPCQGCHQYSCQPIKLSRCKWGIGPDTCGCCQVCLKGPGEMCGGSGGSWSPSGQCGRGLHCMMQNPYNSGYPGYSGYSGYSRYSGYPGYSGYSGYSSNSVGVCQYSNLQPNFGKSRSKAANIASLLGQVLFSLGK